MSGTVSNVYNNIIYALNIHTTSLASLQEQAATGACINRPSDDPSSAYRVLGLNSQEQSLENYIDTIETAINSLEMASDVLSNMSETLSETMADLTQILNGTYGEDEEGQAARDRLAQEIEDVLEGMLSSANTQYVDQYLFSGASTSVIPYAIEYENGQIVSVTYQGSLDERSIEVADNIQTDIFYSGNDIFAGNNRGTPEFYGTTGASAGSGTSNVTGDTWLTVTYDGTNYHLSIDDGATDVIVPSAGDISNIAVTDANGRVLYVDASNITQTGAEMVRTPGTYNLFDTLISIRDILRNERGLDEETISDLIQKCSQSLEEVYNGIIDTQVTLGTKINFMDTLSGNLDNIKYAVETESATLEEADIAQVAIDIALQQTLYEMSLSIAGKLLSLSLLDYL